MNLIIECSKAFLDRVIEHKLSPPLCIGRLKYDPTKDGRGPSPYARAYTRWFIGFCSEADMNNHLCSLERGEA